MGLDEQCPVLPVEGVLLDEVHILHAGDLPKEAGQAIHNAESQICQSPFSIVQVLSRKAVDTPGT